MIMFISNNKHDGSVSKPSCLFGGPEETRTLDLSDANRTLSQLSYRPIYFPFDPENIDIIAMFDVFVKAFFSIPAQI